MQVDPYSTELTVPEAALGFQKVFVVHPRSEFVGNDALALAVVKELSRGDIIVKINTPDGTVEYSHRRFGRYGDLGKPEWLPVLVPMPTAELAINAALAGADPGRQFHPRIVPALPEMTLRCPFCSNEFHIEEYYVPMTAVQRCHACSAEAAIHRFSGPEA